MTPAVVTILRPGSRVHLQDGHLRTRSSVEPDRAPAQRDAGNRWIYALVRALGRIKDKECTASGLSTRVTLGRNLVGNNKDAERSAGGRDTRNGVLGML